MADRDDFNRYWLARQRERGYGSMLTDEEMLAHPERKDDEFHAWQAGRASAPAGQAEGQQAPVQPAGAATANECIRCGRPLSSDDFHTCDACATPQPAAQSGGDWRIDASAGSEILVYKNCSVIEGEQAHWVLGLIKAAPPAQSAVTDAKIEAIGAKIYGTCFTPADRQFARAVLALASSAQAGEKLIRCEPPCFNYGTEQTCEFCATQAERPAGERS